MLVDHVRVSAYERALTQLVRPGDVVADIGTGTGILALLALRAGARKVYAVERGTVAELAARVFQDNDPEGRIELLRTDARDVSFPERPTIIVSETMGVFGIDEDMSQLFRILRPRCAPAVRFVPHRLRLFLAAAHEPGLAADFLSLENSYGLRLQEVRKRAANQPATRRVSAEDLLSSPARIAELSLAYDELPKDHEVQLTIQRAGTLNTLAGWFEVDLTDEVGLTNSPLSAPTSWRHLVLPVDPPLEVEAGDIVNVEMIPRISGSGSLWQWTVSCNGAVRRGDSLRSTNGGVRELAEQLGMEVLPAEHVLPSKELQVLVALCGGNIECSIDEMAARVMQALPSRFASEKDARDEVLRRLASLGALG